MIVDVIDSVPGLLGLESDWRSLWQEAGSLPFMSWEWCVSWWDHLSRRSMAMTDRLSVRSFRDASGKLLAIAPLMTTEMPARGPLRIRCLQFFGADPNITELRGILCRPDLQTDVYRALLAHLFEHKNDWDWIVWDGVLPNSDIARLIEGFGALHVERAISEFLLDLPTTWEQFKSTRSRNVKESLRKCSNSLKRDSLVPVSRVAEGGAELDDALRAVVRLHAARSTRTDTVKHADVFKTPAASRFLFEVCGRHAALGEVKVFSLELENRIVAARIAFVWGRTMYLYYSGYDPAFSKYSVMTTVVADAIRYAISHGYRTVNLSMGNDVSKTRWSPREVKHIQAVQPSPTVRGPLVSSLYSGAKQAFRMASTYAGRAGRSNDASRAEEPKELGPADRHGPAIPARRSQTLGSPSSEKG